MNLKDYLTKLKNTLLSFNQNEINRDYEFNTELENHEIGNQKIYRLRYIRYYRIEEHSYPTPNNIGKFDWRSKPFILPNDMTRDEAFKVLSYLTDFIEKRDDIDIGSITSVRTLDNVLNLERFKFTRIDEENEKNILDLFTVGGRLLLFKKSNLYSKYFEWYVEKVTLEEVISIYEKYGYTFEDIVWPDKQKKL